MLWVYGHYKDVNSTDVRFWRIKTVPALKGFKWTSVLKKHLDLQVWTKIIRVNIENDNVIQNPYGNSLRSLSFINDYKDF